MVYRTEIKIKPADLTDLTVTTDLSSWNLERFTIDDNALIGGISATDHTTNITISSTGYITKTILFSDIPPTIYLIPANEVEKLSDGTNSYPIADKMARLMLEDKADINDIPTNNNQLTNGAGYITTTTKTVTNDGCTFVISNGLKIITSTIQLTANTDYSWSYGTTFSNTPTIFIGRKTGATSTVTAYAPWVRGDVGKSSSTIYATTGGTYMLLVIGN